MSPNNQTISELNDKNEDIIDCLKKLIIEEKKCISYTYVSLRFGVHVKQAIETLDKFVAEERSNGHTFSLNYLLSGNNDSTDNCNEIKMERFLIINESDINTSVDWFKNGFNKHIYSVGLGENNDKIDLNFDDFDYEVNDKKDLIYLQNLTYVKNSNIEFRNIKRRTAIKPNVNKNDDNSQQKSTLNEKKESENKPKIKTNSKNAKKNKVSNMFSKIKTEVKVENEDKESDDPFKSESEDESKPNDTHESVNGKEVEELVIKEEEEKKEQTIKNGKRHSKYLISSEDEELVPIKKRGKKYKRVRIIPDSDSDNETKEESPFDKYVSKKEESKPIKKIVERKETHVDEDGYVVTKTVKKEVEDNNDSKSDNSQQKGESNKKTEQNNPKQNLKKTSEKNVDKKQTKPLKDTKSKSQSSITSFFKPKPIST